MSLSAVAGAILFSVTAGCGAPVLTPQTKIGHGESFASGEAKFDAFFEEVLDARTKSSNLDGESPLREKLAEGLGLARNVAADQMLTTAKERADAMKTSGGSLYVQLLPEAKLFTREGKDKGGSLPKAVEDTVKLGVEKSDELNGFGVQIRQIEAKLDDLKHEAETAFPDAQKRAEVLRELDASQEVLEKSRLRAFAESGRALAFVVAVVRAVDTGGADLVAASEPVAPAKTKPKRGGGKSAGGTGKPAAGPAKPAGGAGKPKPKEDFDP